MGKLVGQLAAEVLVLGGIAALLGLGGSRLLLGWIACSIDTGDLPFWLDRSPQFSTALCLALVTSALAIARGELLASTSGVELPKHAIATAQLDLAPEPADAAVAARRERILDAVRRLPGVAAAVATSSLPYRSAPLARSRSIRRAP